MTGSALRRNIAERVGIACADMTVPMEKLDDLVARHLKDRLLDPTRLEAVFATVLDRRQERTELRREYSAELNKR